MPINQSALVVALSLAATGCILSSGEDESVQELVSSVSTADGSVRAQFIAGRLPSAGAGPTLSVETNGAVIPGGTAPTRLSADRAFTTIVIAVDSFGGYYLLTLPTAVTSAELIVTLSQGLALTSFDWVYGVGAGGSFGGYQITPTNVVVVGTGEVQVSLSWNTAADLDLHVVDPSGEEIYWAARESRSGGELDLDSNAACYRDGARNENITWPLGAAPAGTYRVLVDYWSNCGTTSTDYTVTVNVKGRAPQTFTGTFSGDGNFGGAGDGTPITTFVSGASARTASTSTAPIHVNLGSFEVVRDPSRPIHTKH